MEIEVTLADLVRKYFDLMRAKPSIEDLARFSMAVPAHLQLQFLGWLCSRANELESMSASGHGKLLN